MSNPQKQKGTNFENEIVKLFNEKIIGGKFKRVAGSGAFGERMAEPSLLSDIRGFVENTPLKFKIEAKARTGTTQLAVKKEWLDKVIGEAAKDYSLPMLVCKYIGARSGIRGFVAMDYDTFIHILNLYVETKQELDKMILNEGMG
jgi:Holliday junction resolvase